MGIDISTLQLRSSTGASFTLLVFDTAGHNEVFSAHTPFVTSSGIYWIVYSLAWSDQRISRYVKLWVSSLRRDGDEQCVVGVIGTHRNGEELTSDETRKMDLAVETTRTTLGSSRLAGSIMAAAVDSLRGTGIARLVTKLWSWWGDHASLFTAPERWVRAMECVLVANRTVTREFSETRWQAPVLSLKDMGELLAPIGLTAAHELRRVLVFLDSVGIIFYKGSADGSVEPPSQTLHGVDDIILLRPQIILDALQRIVTPTVKPLMETRTALASSSAWCDCCGVESSSGFLGLLSSRLHRCGLCGRWYCGSHIQRYTVRREVTTVCSSCTPLVPMVEGIASTAHHDVSGLTSTGRLSRSLLESLWSGYSPELRLALECVLKELKFICRAPDGLPGESGVDSSGLSDEHTASDDLFVPCVFVQCPSIGRADRVLEDCRGARQFWIDVSTWPVGMWCDIIGCLSKLQARWQPVRASGFVDDGALDERIWVDRFPGCGTVVHLTSGAAYEEAVGIEEVKVHLECVKAVDDVVRNRIVVSGWYTLASGAREWNELNGREWQLMADVLACINWQLIDDDVLSGKMGWTHCPGS